LAALGKLGLPERLDLSGLKSLSDRSAEFLAVNKKRVILNGRAQQVYEKAKAVVKTKRKTNKKASK
jgi:hypothetical protein